MYDCRRLLGALAALTITGLAQAQTAPGDLVIQPIIASGLNSPLSIRASNDGTGRLFILEQSGAIKIWKPGSGLNATPFITVPVSSSSEQGVLGLAFHPNFATNGRFFVQHTRAAGGPNLGSTADQLTVEYRVSAANPDIADPATRTEILRIADYAGNHNGGDIHFGPDGFLYVSMGDGGAQGDPHGLAQCQWRKPLDSTPANCLPGGGVNYALLGKILRIDINSTTTSPGSEMCGVVAGSATANYAIPASNPNVGTSTTCDEIWHYGLRNPWRFSFDRETNDMLIADVGQSTWEEVNLVPFGNTGGVNFGYRVCEGFFLQGSTTAACTLGTAPILAYGRSVGQSTSGGFRYRGSIQSLRGMYIYADFVQGKIFFAKPDAGQPSGWSQTVWQDTTLSIAGFGEDAGGEMYLADYGGGAIYKFVSPSNSVLLVNGFE